MKNAASEHQKLRKKIRKFTLKLAEIKKKNKKKIGSNVENLRNLEPQPEQTFLIKKTKCIVINIFLPSPPQHTHTHLILKS